MYTQWFNSRNLEVRNYQIEKLQEIEIEIKKSIVVLAACPGSGKTNMSIAYIDLYLQKNPTSKVLVLTHGTNQLKYQYLSNVEKTKPAFTYTTDHTDVTKQVLITLPQSVNKQKLGKFDLVVVDEAHQFYFKNKKSEDLSAQMGMVQNILKQTKPKQQLLLTGTPSPFILKNMMYNGNFFITIVDMHTLYKLGYLENVYLETATTTYKYNRDDLNKSAELKTAIKFTQLETDKTLDSVLTKIISRLKSTIKTKSVEYALKGQLIDFNLGWKNIAKTMFVAKSQEEAKQIKKYFDGHNVKNKMSISDTDSDSSQIEEFKNDVTCSILIVCNRANIGFDYPELINLVDMSGSANVDRLYQMFARLVRKNKKSPKKFFFKVVPNNLNNYYRYIMEAMLHLTHEDFLIQFNGKNFNKLKFPIAVKKCKNTTVRKKCKTQEKIDFIPSVSIESIIKMNELFHKHDEVLNGYIFINMEDVNRQLFGGKVPKGYWTKENLQLEANKYTSLKDFINNSNGAYGVALNLGIMHDITKHMIKSSQFPRNYWNLEKVEELKKLLLTCESRTKFAETYNSTYEFILDNKLNYILELLPCKIGNNFDTLQKVVDDSLKYNSVSEWRKKSKAYGQAYSKKWHTNPIIINHFKNKKSERREALKNK
jgi:superfamily II DNA or RNA helicase